MGADTAVKGVTGALLVLEGDTVVGTGARIMGAMVEVVDMEGRPDRPVGDTEVVVTGPLPEVDTEARRPRAADMAATATAVLEGVSKVRAVVTDLLEEVMADLPEGLSAGPREEATAAMGVLVGRLGVATREAAAGMAGLEVVSRVKGRVTTTITMRGGSTRRSCCQWSCHDRREADAIYVIMDCSSAAALLVHLGRLFRRCLMINRLA